MNGPKVADPLLNASRRLSGNHTGLALKSWPGLLTSTNPVPSEDTTQISDTPSLLPSHAIQRPSGETATDRSSMIFPALAVISIESVPKIRVKRGSTTGTSWADWACICKGGAARHGSTSPEIHTAR